jgi:hypothetical protein
MRVSWRLFSVMGGGILRPFTRHYQHPFYIHNLFNKWMQITFHPYHWIRHMQLNIMQLYNWGVDHEEDTWESLLTTFIVYNIYILVWPVALGQVWTHYKIGKLNMLTLFCNVRIDFLNSQIWKEIMLELNSKPSSVTMFSTDFSFQNLVFWNLFEFSAAEIT